MHQTHTIARRLLTVSAPLLCTGSFLVYGAQAQTAGKKAATADPEYQQVLATLKKLAWSVAAADSAKVIPSASFTKDLGFDSLDAVEVIMELEKAYHISIPDADAERMVTVHDAVLFVRRQLHQK